MPSPGGWAGLYSAATVDAGNCNSYLDARTIPSGSSNAPDPSPNTNARSVPASSFILELTVFPQQVDKTTSYSCFLFSGAIGDCSQRLYSNPAGTMCETLSAAPQSTNSPAAGSAVNWIGAMFAVSAVLGCIFCAMAIYLSVTRNKQKNAFGSTGGASDDGFKRH